jgi:hypothetical protein
MLDAGGFAGCAARACRGGFAEAQADGVFRDEPAGDLHRVRVCRDGDKAAFEERLALVALAALGGRVERLALEIREPDETPGRSPCSERLITSSMRAEVPFAAGTNRPRRPPRSTRKSIHLPTTKPHRD